MKKSVVFGLLAILLIFGFIGCDNSDTTNQNLSKLTVTNIDGLSTDNYLAGLSIVDTTVYLFSTNPALNGVTMMGAHVKGNYISLNVYYQPMDKVGVEYATTLFTGGITIPIDELILMEIDAENIYDGNVVRRFRNSKSISFNNGSAFINFNNDMVLWP